MHGSEYEYIDSYKCIKDSCKYALDKNILAVYDDNKVLYKDLNEDNSLVPIIHTSPAE